MKTACALLLAVYMKMACALLLAVYMKMACALLLAVYMKMVCAGRNPVPMVYLLATSYCQARSGSLSV